MISTVLDWRTLITQSAEVLHPGNTLQDSVSCVAGSREWLMTSVVGDQHDGLESVVDWIGDWWSQCSELVSDGMTMQSKVTTHCRRVGWFPPVSMAGFCNNLFFSVLSLLILWSFLFFFFFCSTKSWNFTGGSCDINVLLVDHSVFDYQSAWIHDVVVEPANIHKKSQLSFAVAEFSTQLPKGIKTFSFYRPKKDRLSSQQVLV